MQHDETPTRQSEAQNDTGFTVGRCVELPSAYKPVNNREALLTR